MLSISKRRCLFLGIVLSAAFAVTSACANTLATKNTTTLTAAEINTLGTVAAINQDEILLGAIALHKHASNNVNKLARMMIDQHGANLAMIMQMANQYHITSLNTSGAKHFLAAGQKDLLKLGALNDDAFSRAYANAMVSGHKDALHLIDTKLLKTATTPAIKKFMAAVRATVSMHLMRSEKVQKEL